MTLKLNKERNKHRKKQTKNETQKEKTERGYRILDKGTAGGEKDKDGLVQSYFPSSRGIKTARYTLALYIDRKTKQLKKSLLFDDVNDPYQLNNLPLDENKEVVEQLYREMGTMLKEIDDPWYTEKILSDRIPY